MKKTLIFGSLALALVLVACAPAASPQAPQPAPTALSTQADNAVTPAPTTPDGEKSGPTQQPPVAVATSRGDKLEASDPASVKMGDGRPTLIEFFRFT